MSVVIELHFIRYRRGTTKNFGNDFEVKFILSHSDGMGIIDVLLFALQQLHRQACRDELVCAKCLKMTLVFIYQRVYVINCALMAI